MGSVTSRLEMMVIDVAWTCHELYYGSASGSGTCADSRPCHRRRPRRLQAKHQQQPKEEPPAAPAPPPPRRVMPVEDDSEDDDEEDWRPPRVASHASHGPPASSTPKALHQHIPHQHIPHRRRRATVSLYSVSSEPRDTVPAAARRRAHMNVPYSTLQAMLFRCTAARNGCLSSKSALGSHHRVQQRWGTNRAATL